MNGKAPRRLIAVVLALLVAPLGMLYLRRPHLAFAYFALTLLVAGGSFWFHTSSLFTLLPALLAFLCAVHAYYLGSTVEFRSAAPWYSKWYGLVWLVIAFGALVIGARSFVVEPFRVPSVSMEPTLPKGSYLLASKYGFGNYGTYGFRFAKKSTSSIVERSDLIVFDGPPDQKAQFVMRVVAIEGDRIDYTDNRLTVNGSVITRNSPATQNGGREEIQEEGYRIYVERSVPSRDVSTVVAKGNVYVLGDNRSNSYDSRFWGQLAKDKIVGRVIAVAKP
jgi:signal peptidase I